MKIFINVATINNYNDVLNTLLDNISNSGLYDAIDGIFMVVCGEGLLHIPNLNKYRIIRTTPNLNLVEFPTLDYIWKYSQNFEDKILYIHTKGVTKPDNIYIKDWVEYMSYFNIQKWYERIEDLSDYDAVGVNLSGNIDDYNTDPSKWGYGKAPLHFSGNFWWANTKYIKKLINPLIWTPNHNYLQYRVMCEMWICSGGGNYKSVHNSNINHYVDRYENYKYIESKK